MPIDRLALLLIVVVCAAGGTIWLWAFLTATVQVPMAGLLGVPALLAAFVVWRVVADRLRSRDDDHYDGLDG